MDVRARLRPRPDGRVLRGPADGGRFRQSRQDVPSRLSGYTTLGGGRDVLRADDVRVRYQHEGSFVLLCQGILPLHIEHILQ